MVEWRDIVDFVVERFHLVKKNDGSGDTSADP
jgi:hypothetical protein